MTNPDPVHADLSRSDNPKINADPPAASGIPLEGQQETNQPQTPDAENATKDTLKLIPAYQFGWQSYLQYGRSPSKTAPSFEALEPQLAQQWEERQKSAESRQPWAAARDVARDAWAQVQNAMSGEESVESRKSKVEGRS